jgi:hypothetical protein
MTNSARTFPVSSKRSREGMMTVRMGMRMRRKSQNQIRGSKGNLLPERRSHLSRFLLCLSLTNRQAERKLGHEYEKKTSKEGKVSSSTRSLSSTSTEGIDRTAAERDDEDAYKEAEKYRKDGQGEERMKCLSLYADDDS